MAQDDYYYEIQLTNKQLVFYFMAGATGLILSFLAGVMVGRGVDATGGEVQAAGAKAVREERIVPEEAKPAPPPSADEMTYAQRLESEKPDDGLDKAKPAPAAKEPAPAAKEAPKGKEAGRDKEAPGKAGRKASRDKPAPEPKTPAPSAPAPAATAAPPAPAPAVAPAKPAGSFTIQVGAFKDKSAAESVVARLKAKGYAAYVVSPDGPEGGLFNVRVGSYPAHADAERVEAKLKDEEKFKPFIVHQ